MNCPVCDRPLRGTRCPACGMTSALAASIRATSRRYLTEGLRKAMSDDYENACEDLRHALRYDKTNAEAWNLLGLIAYHRGEIGESVRAWTYSLRYQPENNRAAGYLQDLKKNPRQYESLCESLRLYNEALDQAQKGDMEFAIVRLRKAVSQNRSFVRAYLLLALCYIQSNHLKKAAGALDKAERIEPRRLEPERYREYIQIKQADGESDVGQEIQDFSRNFYVQQNMYEPDMQEISSGKTPRRISMKNWSAPIMQLLLFFFGVLCCLGFMITLYVPNKTSEYRQNLKETTEALSAASDQTAELEASLSEQAQQLEEYRQQIANHQKELDDLRDEYADSTDTSQEDLLWQALTEYNSGSYTDSADTLYQIDSKQLSEKAAAFYTELFSQLQNKVVATLSNEAYAQYAAAYALKGDEQTAALEAVLPEVEKALYFAQGTNWEAWQLYYKASICRLLGRTDEALEAINQFFTVYRGGTDDDIYGWASSLRTALQS